MRSTQPHNRPAHAPRPTSGSRPHHAPAHAGKRETLNYTEARKRQKFRGPAESQGPAPVVVKNPDAVRFIPLGGLEEIGRNCSFFEYKNEIVIVDVGIQFPEEETPGVDYIIPNIEYLAQKKQNVAGIVLTHGHYDHIAAIHYIIERLGNPIIYTSEFTRALVTRRHEEFPNAPKLRFVTVKEGSKVRISEHFSAEFFSVEHTIPEAYGFVLDTPAGKMVSFGDFRIEYSKNGEPRNLELFERLGAMHIHSAFIDSTNADIPGHVPSEETVEENLEMLIKGAHGRIIIASFASLVDRLLEVIKIADRHGRKVAVNGRSMKDNLEIAKNLGHLKDNKGVLIPLEDIGKYKDNQIVILTTGTQGESNAGLMRIVNGEHKVVHLKQSDTVVFSSSVVPGNERSVQALQDNIARQVDELYNSKLLDIHASGHCHSEDAKAVLARVKPKFVVPIHGYYFKRKSLVKHAEAIGMKREQVIMMDNGQVAELTPDKFTLTGEVVPAYYVMVDGLGVGDVEEVVLRDRRSLAQEGMVVIIISVDRHNGRLLKNPDIISRGFIYLKDNQGILEEIRKRLRGLLTRLPAANEAEPDYLKTIIRDQIGQFLYTKTKRRPMLLPVIIEI
ncbi:MAG TPA: ribonuclease J [Candidatus Paceibacterota bacterium]|nr:ribonuclease J [Candidatus Paceibacterota bacterium]